MAEKSVEDELAQLRSDFGTLQKDVSELTSLLKELGAERVDEYRSSAADSINARREQFRARADALRGRGQQAAQEFEQMVGGHPETSLAIAFGFGFVVARLLDSGGRR